MSDHVVQDLSDPSVIRNRIDALDPGARSSLEAAEALIAKVAANANNKGSKQIARKIISSASKVIEVVEGVSELHPIAKTTVVLFKALIKLELDRQSNNEQIAVIFHSMNSLMYNLRYLAQVLEMDDELKSSLDDNLAEIAETMKSFGTFSEVYYKYKQSTFRILKSGVYKERLDGFFQTFTQQKEYLKELLGFRATVWTQDMHSQVSTLTVNVGKIINMIGDTTPKEHQALDFVRQHGGPAGVIDNDTNLSQLAGKLGDKLNGLLKLALREDFDHLLSENMVQFNLKVEGATIQIQNDIERSKEMILRRLDAGPHELIVDEDVRSVWKEMQWRTTVKSRVFVDALHEHFELQFRKKNQATGVKDPDEWTLSYLSKVMYHPAIGDAIDEDGSGFVSVHKANLFFGSRPAECSIPQWLAFWATGWFSNNKKYYTKINKLIDDIGKAAKKRKASNKDAIDRYLETLAFTKPIILDSFEEGAEENDMDLMDDHEMSSMQENFMAAEQDKLEASLKKNQYHLEEWRTLIAVIGRERVELSIMPLLFKLLEHHHRVILKAQHANIEEHEVDVMNDTLQTVFWSFYIRMQDLIRGWKQQRMNFELHIQCYAEGLYYGLYQESQKPDNVIDKLRKLYYDDEDEGDDDDDEDGEPDSERLDKFEQLSKRVDSIDTRLANIESILKALATGSHTGGRQEQVNERLEDNRYKGQAPDDQGQDDDPDGDQDDDEDDGQDDDEEDGQDDDEDYY